jgi:succinate dehydrogenase hydrophobic anchor subunit
MQTFRVLAIKAMILFVVGALVGLHGFGGTQDIFEDDSCTARGVGIFIGATILFLIVVALDIATYTMVQKAGLDSTNSVELEKPRRTGATGVGVAKW